LQGLTGANGVAEESRDSSGAKGLKIDITIAAVNDSPTVETPPDFSAAEDVPLDLDGLDMDDVDADEVCQLSTCHSRLAVLEFVLWWMTGSIISVSMS
jgi:hypothetical protein